MLSATHQKQSEPKNEKEKDRMRNPLTKINERFFLNQLLCSSILFNLAMAGGARAQTATFFTANNNDPMNQIYRYDVGPNTNATTT